ncbi:TPA: hypothetical protein LU109_003571 [Enterobacter hormaechei subsp. xiangfangensis]|nr:hypothetical protein [Enterobacter hormaechei subsp. xiangfangensis]
MRRLTQPEALERFRATHGDHYDYSRVIYRTMSRNVIIGCPVHSWFQQEPAAHVKGSGCPECAIDRRRK